MLYPIFDAPIYKSSLHDDSLYPKTESNKPNPWYTTEEGYHRTVSKYLSEHSDIDISGLYEICGNPKMNPFSTSCARWFRKIMKNKLK